MSVDFTITFVVDSVTNERSMLLIIPEEFVSFTYNHDVVKNDTGVVHVIKISSKKLSWEVSLSVIVKEDELVIRGEYADNYFGKPDDNAVRMMVSLFDELVFRVPIGKPVQGGDDE